MASDHVGLDRQLFEPLRVPTCRPLSASPAQPSRGCPADALLEGVAGAGEPADTVSLHVIERLKSGDTEGDDATSVLQHRVTAELRRRPADLLRVAEALRAQPVEVRRDLAEEVRFTSEIWYQLHGQVLRAALYI